MKLHPYTFHMIYRVHRVIAKNGAVWPIFRPKKLEFTSYFSPLFCLFRSIFMVPSGRKGCTGATRLHLGIAPPMEPVAIRCLWGATQIWMHPLWQGHWHPTKKHHFLLKCQCVREVAVCLCVCSSASDNGVVCACA